MSKILDRIMSIIENNFGSCECPEDEHCSFCACKEEIAPLIEIQTKRVENLKKSNEFYSDPDNYQRGSSLPHGFCTVFDSIEDDYDRVKSHPVSYSFYRENLSSYGGKLARSCQAIDQELEKRLGEVK